MFRIHLPVFFPCAARAARLSKGNLLIRVAVHPFGVFFFLSRGSRLAYWCVVNVVNGAALPSRGPKWSRGPGTDVRDIPKPVPGFAFLLFSRRLFKAKPESISLSGRARGAQAFKAIFCFGFSPMLRAKRVRRCGVCAA